METEESSAIMGYPKDASRHNISEGVRDMAISEISLTASMRSNLLSLQSTQKLMDTTQDRLSTGKKVNSAMDNPTNYFTAQSLTARANDLDALMDSIGQAISTLETADQGITTLTDFVEQAKSLANSARDTANVKSSVTSSVTFDPLNVKNQKVVDVIGGINDGDSFTIRLGKSTTIEGTTNLNETQTLTQLGFAAGDAMEVLVDGESYTFVMQTGAGVTEQPSNRQALVGVDTTLEDFLAGIVETIGRKDISVGLVDGKIEMKTLDNSSLVVRSYEGVNQKRQDATIELTGAGGTIADTVLKGTGELKVGDVTLTAGMSSDAVIKAFQSDKNYGAYVKDDGNIAIFKRDGSNIATTDFTAVDPDDVGTDDVAEVPTPEASNEFVLDGATANRKFNDGLGIDTGYTVTITDDMTAEDFRKALSALEGIEADFNDKGNLIIYGEEGDDLIITDQNGKAAALLGVEGSATNGNNERATYASQFDKVLTQIDQLVQDTSYKGINLLNGDDLTVNFNETRTSFLEIKGVTFDSKGIGLTTSDNEWKSNEDIDKSLTQIEKATSLLRAQASEFGQNLATVTTREDFTDNMINNLVSGSDKLTLADMNEEAANMLALRTRQQLATNSLSLASQAAQSVLSLF